MTAAFGINGALKVFPLTDFADRFAPGAEILLSGQARRVEWSKPGHPTLTVKLAGIDDRTQAELHRGTYLEVPAAAAMPLADGAYYHHQLIGLDVATAAGRPLGRLSSVMERPANDVWVVLGGDGAEHLVPATRDAIESVDLERRLVTVRDWVFQVEEVR